jgi:mannose-6-phosphate isomerase
MPTPEAELKRQVARFHAWLFDHALPLWWEKGADRARGGFEELLGLDGNPVAANRRARVQGRQSYVYALGGHLGWKGPWRTAAEHGLAYLDARYRNAEGLYVTCVHPDGSVADDTVTIYDQAFALLALAWAQRSSPQSAEPSRQAEALLQRLRSARAHHAGGFREAGPRPFQSNPHMHLFEAALAWIESAPSSPMGMTLAGEMAGLARRHFIDEREGYLREFFDAEWRPESGAAGRIVEPGHQFEWAWLMARWSRVANDADARSAARRLYAAGVRGVDPNRHAAVDEMDDSFAVTRAGARLWPQTERLKAALILAEFERGETRERYLDDAVSAAKTLWTYVDTATPGVWRDKLQPDGVFVEEPAPASSFYHIACAIACLRDATAE